MRQRWIAPPLSSNEETDVEKRSKRITRQWSRHWFHQHAALILFGSESLRITFRFAVRKHCATYTRLDHFPFSGALVTRLLFFSRVNIFSAPIIPYTVNRKNSKVPLNRVRFYFFIVLGPRASYLRLGSSLPSFRGYLSLCVFRFTVVSGDITPAFWSLSFSLSLFSRFNQRPFLFLAAWKRFQPAHSSFRQASNRAAQSFRTRRLFSVMPFPPFEPSLQTILSRIAIALPFFSR